MKTKHVFLGIAVALLFTNSLSAQSCDNGHKGHGGHGSRGHSHGHHGGDHSSNSSKINKNYLLHYTGQDYKLTFLSDSTIKLDNDKVYPVTKIRRGIYLANWPDKNSTMLVNVIDWQEMKVFSTKTTSDKKAVTVTASISEEAAPVTTPVIKDEKTAEPVKKN
jgi:hypothetical protein